MSYTIKHLLDVEDVAPANGFGEIQEARFPRKDLEAVDIGLAFHRMKPGRRGFAHRHDEAEEIYVVVGGSGRVKLGDELAELEPLDAVRVAPEVTRAFEAGPDGLQILVFGPHRSGDGEVLKEDVWGD